MSILNFQKPDEVVMLDSDEREQRHKGVSEYVHVPVGTNLDAGTYDADNNWVRYGAKHNDID